MSNTLKLHAGASMQQLLATAAMTAGDPLAAERIEALVARDRAIVQSHCPALTERDWSALCAATASFPWHASNTVLNLCASVEDACAVENLEQTWGIDGQALTERLRAMSPAALFAVAEVLQRVWERSDHDAPLREALVAAGARFAPGEALVAKA